MSKPPCKHFNTPQGCKFGPNCKFAHIPSSSTGTGGKVSFTSFDTQQASSPTTKPSVTPATRKPTTPSSPTTAPNQAFSWTNRDPSNPWSTTSAQPEPQAAKPTTATTTTPAKSQPQTQQAQEGQIKPQAQEKPQTRASPSTAKGGQEKGQGGQVKPQAQGKPQSPSRVPKTETETKEGDKSRETPAPSSAQQSSASIPAPKSAQAQAPAPQKAWGGWGSQSSVQKASTGLQGQGGATTSPGAVEAAPEPKKESKQREAPTNARGRGEGREGRREGRGRGGGQGQGQGRGQDQGQGRGQGQSQGRGRGVGGGGEGRGRGKKGEQAGGGERQQARGEGKGDGPGVYPPAAKRFVGQGPPQGGNPWDGHRHLAFLEELRKQKKTRPENSETHYDLLWADEATADVWFQISLCIYDIGGSVADILAIGSTCKNLNHIFDSTNILWEQMYRRDFSGDFIPEPGIEAPIGVKQLKNLKDWEIVKAHNETNWKHPGTRCYYFPVHFWNGLDEFFSQGGLFNPRNNKLTRFLADKIPTQDQDKWQYMFVSQKVWTLLRLLPMWYTLTGRTEFGYACASHMYCNSKPRGFFKKFFWTDDRKQTYIKRYKYMIRAHTTQYAFEENLAMPLQNFELNNTIGLEFKAVSVHDNFFILKLNSEIGGFRERADLLGYLFKDFFLEFLQLEEGIGSFYRDWNDFDALFVFPHIQENLTFRANSSLDNFVGQTSSIWGTAAMDFGIYQHGTEKNLLICAWGADLENFLENALPEWKATHDPNGEFLLEFGKKPESLTLPELDAHNAREFVLVLDNFKGSEEYFYSYYY